VKQRKQEAHLTLRGQRVHAEILKGNPKYPTFPLGVVLWWSLANPSCVTFEVPTFSHCVNIKVEPQNLGKLPRAKPTLSSACDFMMGLGKPQQHAKFEVAGFSYYGNIR